MHERKEVFFNTEWIFAFFVLSALTNTEPFANHECLLQMVPDWLQAFNTWRHYQMEVSDEWYQMNGIRCIISQSKKRSDTESDTWIRRGLELNQMNGISNQMNALAIHGLSAFAVLLCELDRIVPFVFALTTEARVSKPTKVTSRL